MVFGGRWKWVGETVNEEGETTADVYEDEFGTGYLVKDMETGEETRYTDPLDRN